MILYKPVVHLAHQEAFVKQNQVKEITFDTGMAGMIGNLSFLKGGEGRHRG